MKNKIVFSAEKKSICKQKSGELRQGSHLPVKSWISVKNDTVFYFRKEIYLQTNNYNSGLQLSVKSWISVKNDTVFFQKRNLFANKQLQFRDFRKEIYLQ